MPTSIFFLLGVQRQSKFLNKIWLILEEASVAPTSGIGLDLHVHSPVLAKCRPIRSGLCRRRVGGVVMVIRRRWLKLAGAWSFGNGPSESRALIRYRRRPTDGGGGWRLPGSVRRALLTTSVDPTAKHRAADLGFVTSGTPHASLLSHRCV